MKEGHETYCYMEWAGKINARCICGYTTDWHRTKTAVKAELDQHEEGE